MFPQEGDSCREIGLSRQHGVIFHAAIRLQDEIGLRSRRRHLLRTAGLSIEEEIPRLDEKGGHPLPACILNRPCAPGKTAKLPARSTTGGDLAVTVRGVKDL